MQKTLFQKSFSHNKELDFNEGQVADFSVTEDELRGMHFMNACCDTPSVYSCAVDWFLKIAFILFPSFFRDISHDDQCSNPFEIITRVNPIYKAAIASSDTNLLLQVRKPIWTSSYEIVHLLFQETVVQNFYKYSQEIFLLGSPIINDYSLKLLTQWVVHAYDVVKLMKGTQQSFFHMLLKQNWLSVKM